MNFQERKAMREMKNQEDTISSKLYNVIIGATLVLGFVVNALVIVLLLPVIGDITIEGHFLGMGIFMFSGILMVYLSKKTALDVFGYILVSIGIGISLALLISLDIETVLLAVILTGIVTVVMLLLTILWPTLFSTARFTIPICLGSAIIVAVVATIMGYNGDWFSWIFVTVFSLCIGRDFRKAQQYPKTIDNAIDAALDLYLDIMLLFSSILKGSYKKNSGD